MIYQVYTEIGIINWILSQGYFWLGLGLETPLGDPGRGNQGRSLP